MASERYKLAQRRRGLESGGGNRPTAQTILVMAGYRPVADWLCSCLEIAGYVPAIAKDTDEAFRLASIIDIDLIIAWPAISNSQTDEFLDGVAPDPKGAEIPILLVGFRQPPYGFRSAAEWIRAPLSAGALLVKVCTMLDASNRDQSLARADREAKGMYHICGVGLVPDLQYPCSDPRFLRPPPEDVPLWAAGAGAARCAARKCCLSVRYHRTPVRAQQRAAHERAQATSHLSMSG